MLRVALLAEAITFLTAAAMNFGVHIPLGFTTLQFPLRIIPAGIGETVIGAALLLAGLTLNRAASWIGWWLSVGGIAFGLVATSRSRGPAFEMHAAMVALAIAVLALLLWTRPQGAVSTPRPELRPIAGLMAVAGLTLLGASAIHFGLLAPLIVDPFAAAATPEAVLGGIMLAGSIALLSGRAGGWELAVACSVLTVLLTLYGFATTLGTGRAGDITYHVTLLWMLFASVGLLLARGRKRYSR